jgi:transcriptional regulator with XRE-family HTH domain
MTEEEFREALGMMIKSRRSYIGESQSFIAEKLEMSTVGYRHWECGYRTPSVYDLWRISQALRCTVAELLPTQHRRHP